MIIESIDFIKTAIPHIKDAESKVMFTLSLTLKGGEYINTSFNVVGSTQEHFKEGYGENYESHTELFALSRCLELLPEKIFAYRQKKFKRQR